jgi:acetyl-CoA C-acetyltransferase
MALDGRLPVIVGAGQLCRRTDEGDGPEPVDLLADAFRRAERDAGAPILAAADSVRVAQILSWRYRDAGLAVAERLGATPRHTLYTGPGGQWPQALINRTALDIQAGRADVVLVGGAETWRSRTRARAAGRHRSWPRQPDAMAPTELLGEDAVFGHPAELACGVILPVQHYPLIESALRTAAGRSPAEHEALVADLWSRFSHVAADNPDAWSREAYSVAELLEVTSENRMIGLPYRKRWCSNNHVDMAAGLVLCSVERATALGIPRDRWVFPLAGSDAADGPFVSVRADLARSPAIRSAGATAFRLADTGVDDVAHVDLYSCFPSAVELAAAELGLGLDRPLTVTGGLPFAGGPWNDYVTHAVVTMVGVLRADPGSVGLVTGLGGFATKHAVGLYATVPPAGGFRWEAGVSVPPEREVAEGYEGPAAVEAWTVMYDRDSHPETGIATCLTPDGRRAWATTRDAGALAAMASDDLAGRAVDVAPGGRLEL